MPDPTPPPILTPGEPEMETSRDHPNCGMWYVPAFRHDGARLIFMFLRPDGTFQRHTFVPAGGLVHWYRTRDDALAAIGRWRERQANQLTAEEEAEGRRLYDKLQREIASGNTWGLDPTKDR